MEVLRIAVINEDGKIDFINTDSMSKDPHIALMLEYLKEKYPEDEFIKASDCHTGVNKLAIYLCDRGEIVYLNTTTYKDDELTKYGRNGLMLMPKKLYDVQIYNLFKLKDMLADLDELQILYNIKKNGNANIKIGNSETIAEFVKTKRLFKKGK